jgi:UDP-N-acetylmuramoylalanine-D-glutamate ligase
MIENKKIVVIGAARSGIAVVEYLLLHNAQKVILCDDKQIENAYRTKKSDMILLIIKELNCILIKV